DRNVTGVQTCALPIWEQDSETQQNADEAPESENTTADNVFKGQSNDGFGGRIIVELTVEDNQMTDIQITEQSETVGIGVEAIDKLAKQALEAQSADLDVISGATVSSNAFMDALNKAMDAAGL